MPEFPETSHSLIEQVHDPSNAGAWAEFLRIYQPVVYGMARRRGLQNADALDVVQPVFASIAHSIDTREGAEDRPPVEIELQMRRYDTKTVRRDLQFTIRGFV